MLGDSFQEVHLVPLNEADILGVLSETLAALMEAAFSDQTSWLEQPLQEENPG